MGIALIELVGKEVVVRADSQNLKGIVRAVTLDSITLEIKGNTVTVMKSHIAFYVVTGVAEIKKEEVKEVKEEKVSTGNPYTDIALTLLGCRNDGLKCTGVRYFAGKKGDEVTPIEFEKFMAACPCKIESCKKGKFGTFGEIKPEQLSKLLIDSVFGEYPELEQDEEPEK